MGFTDSFRYIYPSKVKYSFWDIRDKSRRENKGWRLDYILCSKWLEPNLKEAEIHCEYWGSDHCPVSCTIDVSNIDLKAFKE
jgi:exodeoxyribonuclease-3